MQTEPTPYKPRCINLRCKSMLVFGEAFEEDPEYQSGSVDFWCLETSKNAGPDGGEAAMEFCCNPERACFREF